MRNKKVELLAPAGSLEKLKWAIMYGADAVYIGGVNYSLRANAKNFTLKEIKEGVIFAHNNNAKVYVTVNIVFHNKDVENLEEYLIELDKIGVDAIIFSDPLVIDIVKKNNLKLELHLSTQASILNKDAAKYYVDNGVSRIVLARECNRRDIKDIIDSLGVDVECFIHGAMCTNISGRCVLSNYVTNRDANRGGCAQVCRFNFNLYDKDKNKISSSDNFTIAPKDLSLANYINDMIDIGIKSFKLEGRMRSIYYVATLLSCYRKLIDNYGNKTTNNEYIKRVMKVLYRCANREVIDQFYNKDVTEKEQYYSERKEDSNQDFLGIVLDYDEDKKEAIVEQRNFFKIGDKVTIFGPNTSDYSYIISKIIDEEENLLDAARHPRQIIKINCDKKVNKYDIMRVNFLD
ncbi:MAG: U32 family peptidase [Bacilli bacterium]|nr:U32 family peptidase [Bacilli bacterium]